MNELKKQGKQLNNQLAAFKKQNAKVEKAITAAINKVREDAKKTAIKKANRTTHTLGGERNERNERSERNERNERSERNDQIPEFVHFVRAPVKMCEGGTGKPPSGCQT